MKNCILILFFLLTIPVFSQKEDDVLLNNFSAGIGRNRMLYLNTEFGYFKQNIGNVYSNIGLGGVPGEASYNEPRHNVLHFGSGYKFKIKFVEIQFGLEPTIYWYGKLNYIHLNGIAGVRLFWDEISIEAGYSPRLYFTHEGVISLPFYFGMGYSF